MEGPAHLTVLADTGPLYALADRSDHWHDRVEGWWQRTAPVVLVPITVVPEVAYLLETRLGQHAAEVFVRSLADGELVVEPLVADDLRRAADLMVAYRDLPLGFVDASVVAMAERLEIREVLTTDRRHFGVVRPRHVEALRLLP